MGRDFLIVNNHTASGNNPESKNPGKTALARLKFKAGVLQTVLEAGAASAASRGRESGSQVSCIVAGDWNLPYSAVEEVMSRHAMIQSEWYVMGGEEKDFIFFDVADAEGKSV